MILRKQFLAHVAQTSPSPMLVEVARAEGSFFYTPEGKRYFDLVAGVSVSNVGHGNPAVVRACKSGVSYIAEPGGSVRDDIVIDTCNKLGVAMAFTGMRLFHH